VNTEFTGAESIALASIEIERNRNKFVSLRQIDAKQIDPRHTNKTGDAMADARNMHK
jgi:hypothetical protein